MTIFSYYNILKHGFKFTVEGYRSYEQRDNKKKRQENKEKLKQFVLLRRVHFTVIFIVISVILVILPALIFGKTFLDDELCKIEILEISSIVVTNVFLVLGTIIAVWQYYISSSQKMVQIDSERINKAVALTEFYKDTILTNFLEIKRVLKKTGIYDVMYKYINSMKHFDKDEMEESFSKSDITKIKNIQKPDKSFDIIFEINKNYDLNLFDKTKDITAFSDDDKKKLCEKFWQTYLTRILNDLEYFSMHFSHGIADDSVIYQSIHSSYIEICCVLYYSIALSREPHKARLYSNVVVLFKKWKAKSDDQKREAMKSDRETSSMGTVVENKF